MFVMPLFGNKFSPKKTPVRKNSTILNNELEELIFEHRVIPLRLGDHEFTFEKGEWISESGQSGTTHRSNQKLKKKIVDLQEENNLLKLKLEITLNMLTQTTAESHLQQREIEKLERTNKN